MIEHQGSLKNLGLASARPKLDKHSTPAKQSAVFHDTGNPIFTEIKYVYLQGNRDIRKILRVRF